MATYEYLNSTGLAELVSQISAKYAAKTDLPTNVSDLTNDSNFQTDSQVTSAIATAISGVTQFDYQIVETLPATGTKGVIYLVANQGSGQNVYDEYIWIVVGETGKFELFGTKELEVVEYVTGSTGCLTIYDGTGENAGKKVIDVVGFVQDAVDKADTALQSLTSTSSTVAVTGIGTTKNIEVSSTIVNGAAAGATAVQPADLGAISNAAIDALFA